MGTYEAGRATKLTVERTAAGLIHVNGDVLSLDQAIAFLKLAKTTEGSEITMACINSLAAPHISHVLHDVTITNAFTTLFEINRSRWGFIFPTANGGDLPRWMPQRAQVNSSYFLFSPPQFQGGQQLWTYMELGKCIEQAWGSVVSGADVTVTVVELVVPTWVKDEIAKLAGRNPDIIT